MNFIPAMNVFDSTNPSTGDFLAAYPTIDGAELEIGLAGVAGATRQWGRSTPEMRSAVLRAIAARLREVNEALARLAVLEVGKTYANALGEI